MPPVRRMFHLQGECPPDEKNKYGSHVRLKVIASDIKQAIHLVEAKHPTVTIHNVQHHGVVDIEE